MMAKVSAILVKSGKFRTLAVTSAARLAELPEVPTFNEIRKDDRLELDSWGGLFAPAKTSRDLIRAIHTLAVRAALEVRKEGSDPGMGAVSESPEAFASFVSRENEKWREIVRISGAKAD